MAVKIFCCYAHEDEAFLKKLKSHLKPLQREGLIDFWYDRDIDAGTEWESKINLQLNAAQIILLLVSPHFITSDYINNVEFRKPYYSLTYDEDHKQYKYHVGLVQDLMLELTRAANYICDAVRQFIDPTFRMVEGKVLANRAFVAYETGEMFDYELISAEYKAEERVSHPYPGLEQFKVDRENRDSYLGDTL